MIVPIPLKRIPMNRVYGIRIGKAYASQHNWYAINAYGGKLLFAFGIFLLAYGWFSLDFVPPPARRICSRFPLRYDRLPG